MQEREKHSKVNTSGTVTSPGHLCDSAFLAMISTRLDEVMATHPCRGLFDTTSRQKEDRSSKRVLLLWSTSHQAPLILDTRGFTYCLRLRRLLTHIGSVCDHPRVCLSDSLFPFQCLVTRLSFGSTQKVTTRPCSRQRQQPSGLDHHSSWCEPGATTPL